MTLYCNSFDGKIKIISASHLSGNLFHNTTGVIKLFFGFCDSLIFIFKLKPLIGISFGSYASLPPCFAIKIFKFFYKINFYIHEQNSIIGRSNKYFVKNANKIFVNFKKDYKINKQYIHKINIVGIPRLIKKDKSNNKIILTKIKNKFTIFLYGGSQGSIPLLECFEKLLLKLQYNDFERIFFIIQCPDHYINSFKNKILKYNIKFEINDFFENLPALLENTDLILSRCGAGTINDIISNKIPSILVPLPSAKDNHQFENAKYLFKKKCGIILDQNNFNSEEAYQFIQKFLIDTNQINKIKEILNKEKILDTNNIMLNLIKNEIK